MWYLLLCFLYLKYFYSVMYILASDFFIKSNKYVFKARNWCCVWGIFKTLNKYLSCFAKQIRWSFIFVHHKWWKLAFKTGFSVHYIHLYLCGQVENTKWILCSRKIGVKCAYLRCTKDVVTMITFHDICEAINLVKEFKKNCVIAN